MKRKSNFSNKAQRKVSRNSDRSAGRAGLHAADQKSAAAKQHGDPLQQHMDAVHLNMNRKSLTK
jgi:hypothetical protein